jgi:rRNA processing protein Krr1/Pno1
MEEQLYTTDNNKREQLISSGFSELEAMRLMHMKDHVTDEIEYREMIEESRRLDFVRWLIAHDRLSN